MHVTQASSDLTLDIVITELIHAECGYCSHLINGVTTYACQQTF